MCIGVETMTQEKDLAQDYTERFLQYSSIEKWEGYHNNDKLTLQNIFIKAMRQARQEGVKEGKAIMKTAQDLMKVCGIVAVEWGRSPITNNLDIKVRMSDAVKNQDFLYQPEKYAEVSRSAIQKGEHDS